MSVSLSDAVDDLLRRQTQDPGRLHLLAQFCIEAFDRERLTGVRGGKANEVGNPWTWSSERLGSCLCPRWKATVTNLVEVDIEEFGGDRPQSP